MARQPEKRKPFDPGLAAGGLFEQAPSPGATEEILDVSSLGALIRKSLDEAIGRVRVKGEMSNFRAQGGHWYFSLKDASARIDCVMFRSDAARASVVPKDGSSFVVTAQVTHYPPQGRTQLQCSKIELAGLGDLDARYRALCEELRSKGWFDPARKKPLPRVPMCIAILTSASSAAEDDCIAAARRSFPATRVILVDVRVQGAQAAQGIANALAAVDAAAGALGIEVILLARGGGSMEDLWAFNELVVAQAIWQCKTPVVTGIGHECDQTIAEFVADLRCATPSRAVTETLPRREALVHELDALQHRMSKSMAQELGRACSRVELAARSRVLTDPATGLMVKRGRVENLALRADSALARRLTAARHSVDDLSMRLHRSHPAAQLKAAQGRVAGSCALLSRAISARLRTAHDRLFACSRTLEAVGPMSVLARGFTITLDEAGQALRSVRQASSGARIRTVLEDGQIESTVDSVTEVSVSNPPLDSQG